MIDFTEVLTANSNRFRQVLADVPDRAPVPSCPGWSAGDLLWHLTEVQSFWSTIVSDRLQTDEQAAAVVEPARPRAHADALALFAAASAQLGSILDVTADDVQVWTWTSVHDVGWVRRRQGHEALIHRVDAEQAAGLRSAIDPGLAEDGIDELLTQFGAVPPAWGTFDPSGRLIEVRSTHSGRSWWVRLGLFRGVDPAGTAHEEPDFQPVVGSAGPADATLAGQAEELLLWLWGRAAGDGILSVGDPVAQPALRRAVVANTQ
jgi:uncharacterized protein (TIGR03083 family)